MNGMVAKEAKAQAAELQTQGESRLLTHHAPPVMAQASSKA